MEMPLPSDGRADVESPPLDDVIVV